MSRIVVIGAGITGLTAARELEQQGHRVTLFEADAQAGGHANTVDVDLAGKRFAVDTGFLVFNHRTYPALRKLFETLQVPTVASEMTFSVSVGPHDFEWAGTDLPSLFAQPSNLASPSFWRMLADIARFNRQATALAGDDDFVAGAMRQPLGQFLAEHRYGRAFRDAYLLPMAAAIWSCPMKVMLDFPVGSFVRFFHNHGLLSVRDRPQWYTVAGGSREYVRRITSQLRDLRLGAPVGKVVRTGSGAAAGVEVHSARHGVERFDKLVLACHSDQALAMLADAAPRERAVLGAIPYQTNQAWLHTDTRLMPRRRRAWAAWNYLSNGDVEAPQVSVSYWLNRLQPLPCDTPLFVSLNPLTEPAAATVIRQFEYAHPVLGTQASAAQRSLAGLQGQRNTWFAGAWTGYGFHEDGHVSGLSVAQSIGAAGDERAAA